MKNQNSDSSLNISERDYKEFMQNGDDFFKIELLRPAKRWYKKAAELSKEPEKAQKRIAECDKLIAFENKVVGLLIIIALVLISLYLLVS